MDQIFSATVKQLIVLFIFIITGFVLKRLKLLPDSTASVLSKLETWVLVPALTLNTFMTKCTPDALAERWRSILFSMVLSVLAVLIANLTSPLFVLLKEQFKDEEERRRIKNIYVYALSFSNLGFMGNALVLAVFGEDILFEYMIFTLFYNIIIYSYGMMILIPETAEERGKSGILRGIGYLFNPIFVSILLGAGIGLSGVKLPDVLSSAVASAGGCMAPVAMILTGFVIGSYSFRSMLLNYKVYIVSVLRLIVFPLLFVIPLKIFGAPEAVIRSAACVTAMPLGINTVIFPAAYGGDPSLGASMALVSHTLSVVTIPFMFMILL